MPCFFSSFINEERHTRVVKYFTSDSYSHLGVIWAKIGQKSPDCHEGKIEITSNGNLRSKILLFNRKLFVYNVLGSGSACQPLLKEWLFNCLYVVIQASMANQPKVGDLSETETALWCGNWGSQHWFSTHFFFCMTVLENKEWENPIKCKI